MDKNDQWLGVTVVSQGTETGRAMVRLFLAHDTNAAASENFTVNNRTTSALL